MAKRSTSPKQGPATAKPSTPSKPSRPAAKCFTSPKISMAPIAPGFKRADIEFHAGRFVIAGTDRAVGIMELAARLHAGLTLPAELPQSLDVKNISDGPPSAPL